MTQPSQSFNERFLDANLRFNMIAAAFFVVFFIAIILIKLAS